MPASTTYNSIPKRARKRDREAWSTIYDQYYPRIFAFLMARLHDSMLAEDLAADVFVSALKAIASYDERGLGLTAWLFRIAHNKLIDHYRRSGIRKCASLDEFERGDNEVDIPSANTISAIPDKIDIESAVQALAADQRQVIYLRFVVELTSSEVAIILGKSIASVKILQHRAVKALKQALEAKVVDWFS